jgi:hypothetical protein
MERTKIKICQEDAIKIEILDASNGDVQFPTQMVDGVIYKKVRSGAEVRVAIYIITINIYNNRMCMLYRCKCFINSITALCICIMHTTCAHSRVRL